jgi:glycosyltransferase involved in cell wall biosynthesis
MASSPRTLPSFDLVVATVDRIDPLERLFDSLDRQSHRRFRVLLVDQNQDDRLQPVIGRHAGLDVVHLRSPRGLSRARNAALDSLTGDIVAFPDDDCAYPDDLLERVADRFAEQPSLDGLTGRAVGFDGRSKPNWKTDSAVLDRENLWNRAISFTMFVRRDVVSQVGRFDEQLGLGSATPWHSGEEIDYLIRATEGGARVEYDPELTVAHDDTPLSPDGLRALGYRDGASIGYILRKHGYRKRVLAPMLVRPLGGTLLSIARLDRRTARFHAATFRGRLAGYRGVSA